MPSLGHLAILRVGPPNHRRTASRILHLPGLFRGGSEDPVYTFSRRLVEILNDANPAVAPLVKKSNAAVIGFDHKNNPIRRPNLITMGTSVIKTMQEAHELMISQVSNMTLPYVNGTRGIVSTAGGANLPIFLISLRMLRRTGSNLPVELFLRSDEDHGQYLCDELLPSLNARCVVLDDFLDSGAIKLEKYQYKIFSILFSTFEEVLLLDSDNFPVHPPDHVFLSEPFLSHGLVTWPDFWISTASEKFYTIQGTKAPPTNLRASTESGQVVVTKRTHSPALLVAAYYNYYGPSHFYPLMTQGGPGEGDKESFLAGAAAVGAPFYQVSQPVSVLGYTENGEMHGVAMLQYDPMVDYQHLAKPLPFMVHANFPKMDPNTLFGFNSPVINSVTGVHHRLWGNKTSTIKQFGVDLEADLWEEIRYVACNLGGVFAHWKAVASSGLWKGTCEMVEDHIEKVFPV